MKLLDDKEPIPYKLNDPSNHLPLRWNDRIPFRLTRKAAVALGVRVVREQMKKGRVFYADTDLLRKK